MAQYQQQEPIHRTDAADAAPVVQDRGFFHSDKPTSVTDTGYGGTLGVPEYGGGEGPEKTMPEAQPQNKKGGVTEKVKDALYGVKDTITGHKKHDGAVGPTAPTGTTTSTGPHPTTYSETTGTDHEKVGCIEKMKDLITGQKPGHGRGGETGGNLHPASETGYVGDQHGTTPTAEHHKREGVKDKIEDKVHGGQGLGDYPQQNYGLQETGSDYNTGGGVQGSGNPGYGYHNVDTGRKHNSGLQGEGWPQPVQPTGAGRHHATSGATYTDTAGNPIEGSRADNTKKEGIVSKMLDKIHLGSHKNAPS